MFKAAFGQIKSVLKRIRHQHVTVVVEVLGVIVITATLVLTYCNNKSTSEDMSNALGTMANIAGTLSNQQEALIDQSKATQNLAEETNTVANAADRQATNTEKATGIAQLQADTADKQLRQNMRLFAEQHRPVIQYDATSKHFNFVVAGEQAFWSYGFKNYGQSPAYGLKVYYSLSVRRLPFQSGRISAPEILVPGDAQDTIASFKFPPYQSAPEEYAEPVLHLRFEYFDGLGRKYVDRACREITANNRVSGC